MKVRGELLVTETEELKKSVALDLLYQEELVSPEELFEKGKKISNVRVHRCGSAGDNNDGCCEVSP